MNVLENVGTSPLCHLCVVMTARDVDGLYQVNLSTTCKDWNTCELFCVVLSLCVCLVGGSNILKIGLNLVFFT